MYSLASSTWNEEEVEAAIAVLRSGNTTMGKHVENFERNFAKRFGSKFAVMSNSGSSANLLAVAALVESGRVKPGTVLVPAVSWSTTYFPFHQYGFKLRFADVDLDTLNYDLEHVGKILQEEKIDIICAVNLLGNSNDFDKLKKLAGDIPIFEDNCESMGAKFGLQHAGSIGLIGSFSTFFSHHMCTMEGGMSVTDDENLYHHMLSIRAHGWTRNLPKHNFVTQEKSDNPFEESFKFVLPGYNLRPLEIEAAIGNVQLQKFDDFLTQRKKNFEIFRKTVIEKFDKSVRFQQEIGESSWFGFSMIFSSNDIREKVIKSFNIAKIDCRPIVTGNFCRQPVIGRMRCKFDKLSNADIVHDAGLFVGNHHFDLSSEILELEIAMHSALS